MKPLPIIKFNAPPENCERCWKERKKVLKDVLNKLDLKSQPKLLEIKVPIVGKMSQADLDRLDKFLNGELIKMKKGYIHLTYLQV